MSIGGSEPPIRNGGRRGCVILNCLQHDGGASYVWADLIEKICTVDKLLVCFDNL